MGYLRSSRGRSLKPWAQVALVVVVSIMVLALSGTRLAHAAEGGAEGLDVTINGEDGTIYKAVGDSVTLQVSCDCSGDHDQGDVTMEGWHPESGTSIESAFDYLENPVCTACDDSGFTVTGDAKTPGTETVSGACSVHNNSDSETLVIFDVQVTDPLTTIYEPVGDEIDLECEVTPGAASGGEYDWSVEAKPWGADYMWTNAGTATPRFEASTPGLYQLKVSYTKGNATAIAYTPFIYFVGVKRIEIRQNGQWTPVDGGDKEVILKGTKYTFRAIRAPESAAQWPSGEPDWDSSYSGVSRSDDGDETEVAFTGEYDDRYVEASCGTSEKTVTLDVIVPAIHQVKFDKYDIHDKNDWWGTDDEYGEGHDIACFKQGIASNVKVKFYDSEKLSFDTLVQLRADVHFLDEYITGEDYDRTNVTFSSGTWATEHPVNSEATAQAAIKDDYDVDMQWRYQVKSPNGTDDWISTGDVNNLRYYLIWDDPKGPSANFTNGMLEYACDWAEGEDNIEDIRMELMDEIAGRYDYGYNCHRLASNWIRLCWCVGIDASIHYWERSATPTTVGHMSAMKSVTINPIGPTYGSDNYEFSFHAWAESGSNQYDPTTNTKCVGTWSGYEDDVMEEYLRITATHPYYVWDGNAAGQTSGCEPTGRHNATTTVYPFLCP